jgi:predicted RNA-binding Zn ribbon-like protein
MALEQPAAQAPKPKKFRFVGGSLCLDFCNTVGGKRGVIARENLHGYPEFMSWVEQAGLATGPGIERLGRLESKRPAEAAATLERALELREAIYRIFLAIAEAQRPRGTDLAVLNAELAQALGRRGVAASGHGDGFEWRWSDPSKLDDPLGPVALSAAELLTDPKAAQRVRQCEGGNCGWLFLDHSKNHSRCWCDMRDCGNRAKVRRHRLRHKRG